MYTNEMKAQGILPAMVVRGIVPLPNNEIKLDVGRKASIKAVQEAMKDKKFIVILAQKDITIESPGIEDVNPIGIVGKVLYDLESGAIHKVKVNGLVRCEVLEFIDGSPFGLVNFVTMPAVYGNRDEELASVRVLVKQLDEKAQKIFAGSPELANAVFKGVSADKLTDLLAFNLPLDVTNKIKYLNNPNVLERLKMMLGDIEREKFIAGLESDIETEVRKVINDSQREYYLREKMKVIQDELGDKVKKETDIEELKRKILEKKMPKEIEDKALLELNRYSSLGVASGESSIIRTYLDFIISLPWSEASKDTKDILVAKEQLDKDHYGLEKVKDRILEYLAVSIMTSRTPQAILCFVGPPGVGKTSLARSIATSLNKKFVKQSLGGVKDESEIRGHRRTYLGALPGRVLQGMKRAGVKNPVFLLDEIDKLSSDYKGDPTSALLEVLDSEQNKFFSDHYLEEPYDLSSVFFIATANYLENIPAPLRDRLEIVELSSYTEYEKLEIAKRHLVRKQLDLHGLEKESFSITDEAILEIVRNYTKEAGVRELERNIGTLIRRSIKNILMGKDKVIAITLDNLETWLGKAKYQFNKVDMESQVGVVTGLAYTQFGGDTLPVEVTYYKGEGKFVLTGKLGDVMKESAQAALSYVKSNAVKYQIDANLFKENDIHIHVPEGAVPKDGPSAGVTIATAIISAFSHRKVNHLIGMTGEITLRGKVLPIGGIREKSIAAQRSGLKTIIIPKANVKDVEDIPEAVRNQLTIQYAETLDDVVKNVFV